MEYILSAFIGNFIFMNLNQTLLRPSVINCVHHNLICHITVQKAILSSYSQVIGSIYVQIYPQRVTLSADLSNF